MTGREVCSDCKGTGIAPELVPSGARPGHHPIVQRYCSPCGGSGLAASVSASAIAADKVVIRRNDDGTLDEVIVQECHAHVEQMADNSWWLGLSLPDGTLVHVNFTTGRAKIAGTVWMEDRS